MLLVQWKENGGPSDSEMWLFLFQDRTRSLMRRQLNPLTQR